MLLGKKVGMTQLFTDEGRCVPVTMVSVNPATVVRTKTAEVDGYDAIQVGYGEQKETRLNKSRKGEVGDNNFAALTEFKTTEGELPKVGQVLDGTQFEVGDKVTVTSTSKAKGFQGVVKRWNFAGSPKTHGQKHTLRAPGSIGAGGPQRVFKGLKMGGRTGGDRVTVKNLVISHVDNDNNTIYIKGAIPGRKGTLVEVVKTPENKKKLR